LAKLAFVICHPWRLAFGPSLRDVSRIFSSSLRDSNAFIEWPLRHSVIAPDCTGVFGRRLSVVEGFFAE